MGLHALSTTPRIHRLIDSWGVPAGLHLRFKAVDHGHDDHACCWLELVVGSSTVWNPSMYVLLVYVCACVRVLFLQCHI